MANYPAVSGALPGPPARIFAQGSVCIATTFLLLLFLAHGDRKMTLQSKRILIALLFVVFIFRYATEIVGI